MKKGFTLIELLAVIVILAIIALIATPIVLNIINEAKESAVLRSAEFYLEGVETSIASAVLKNITVKDGTYNIMENGNICLETYNITTKKCEDNDSNQNNNELIIEMNGSKPTSGIIKIEGGTISQTQLSISDKPVWKNPTTGKIEIKDIKEKLEPGLYDENDVLITSWDDLTSLEYKSFTYYGYLYTETGEIYEGEITSPILNVDEKGILTTVYDINAGHNYSAEYLVGKLVMDDSVTDIGEGAFDGFTGLTGVISSNSLTGINSFAFRNCTNLTSITLPESVTSIGMNAFDGCESLTNVTLPNNVRYIAEVAFWGSGLKEIIIPNSVESIGEAAFANCKNLTTVKIGSGLAELGWQAFADCTNLSTIIVDPANTVYDGRNNSNAIIDTSSNYLILGCNNTIIPEGVTSIGDSAFSGSGLKEITIPSTVESIGISAFSGCTNLKEITIPESVTEIYEEAFYGCSSLTSVVIKGKSSIDDFVYFADEVFETENIIWEK